MTNIARTLLVSAVFLAGCATSMFTNDAFRGAAPIGDAAPESPGISSLTDDLPESKGEAGEDSSTADGRLALKSTLPEHESARSEDGNGMPGFERFLRGSGSSFDILLHPLGPLVRGRVKQLRTADRLEHGLVLVLPGVEGESLINQDLALGLADGGVTQAIEIYDWTTGVILFFPYHLRSWNRNLAQAEIIARKITDYQAAYPGRPVHIVGHSAGGALALLALERLPPGKSVTSAILMLPAISPGFNLTKSLAHTEQGIWNFRSNLDLFVLGLGTLLGGTVDGRHTVSAGAVGFRTSARLSAEERQNYEQKLHQVPFTPEMVSAFNFGGHMGSVNRVFIAERVAPLLTPAAKAAD